MMTLSQLTALHEVDQRARAFTKMVRAHLLNSDHPLQALEPAVADRYQKAATAAIATGDLTGLLQESRGFVNLLNRRTIVGQLSGSISVPPNLPIPTPESDPEPTWVAEGRPIPVARFSFSDPYSSISKYALLVAFSEQVVRRADDRALNLIERVILRSASRAEDRLFVSDDAATSESPAGILNGLAPAGGGSPSELTTDMELLWTSVRDGDPDAPVFILSARAAVYFAGLRVDGAPLFPNIGPLGGSLFGVPAIISRAAGNRLILLDAAQLAVTDDGLIIESSREASVQLVDNPTDGPASLVSSFQTNTRIVRLIRYISWLLLASDAVSFIELPMISGSPA